MAHPATGVFPSMLQFAGIVAVECLRTHACSMPRDTSDTPWPPRGATQFDGCCHMRAARAHCRKSAGGLGALGSTGGTRASSSWGGWRPGTPPTFPPASPQRGWSRRRGAFRPFHRTSRARHSVGTPGMARECRPGAPRRVRQPARPVRQQPGYRLGARCLALRLRLRRAWGPVLRRRYGGVRCPHPWTASCSGQPGSAFRTAALRLAADLARRCGGQR